MRRLFTSLFGQVLIALVAGIVVGIAWPDAAIALRPLSDGFIKLIKMLIAPLVFGVVVHGIVGAGDLRKVGRVGLKSLVYFEAVTTLALILGVVLAYTFQPGQGMHIDPATLDPASLSAYASKAAQVTDPLGFVMRIIPATAFGAFVDGDILQVLLIAILFGVGLSLYGDKGRVLGDVIEHATQVLFRIISIIARLAPLGVLGAVAFTVGRYGVGALQQLGMLVMVFYLGVAIFVVGVLGTILRIAGFNIFKLLRYLRAELLIVAGTASSDAVLPQVMQKLERLGIKDSTVGLVVPTGYSFNLDAFSLYLTLAVVFIAQATDTPLAFSHLLMILGISLLTSKGAHGIPGSAIVVLAASLSAIPDVPMIGLVLVLAIDWFVGMARALGNVIGNCVAAVAIAVWEGDIDRAQAHRTLDGPHADPSAAINPVASLGGGSAPAPLSPQRTGA